MAELFKNLPDHLPKLNRNTLLAIAGIIVLVGGGLWLSQQTDAETVRVAAATATQPPLATQPAAAENPVATPSNLNSTPSTENKTVCVGPYAGPGTTLWSAWNKNGQPETVTVVYPDGTKNLIINLDNGEEPYGVLPSDYPPGTCLEIANP